MKRDLLAAITGIIAGLAFPASTVVAAITHNVIWIMYGFLAAVALLIILVAILVGEKK